MTTHISIVDLIGISLKCGYRWVSKMESGTETFVNPYDNKMVTFILKKS